MLYIIGFFELIKGKDKLEQNLISSTDIDLYR